MPNTSVDWTDEKIAELSRLWSKGYSARQIAEQLGNGATRGAVIGKANRLGLSKPSKSSITRQQRKKKRAEKDQAEKLPVPTVAGANLFTLTKRSCRWPMWDHKQKPTQQFCGADVVDGQSYCAGHYAKSYREKPTSTGRKRAA